MASTVSSYRILSSKATAYAQILLSVVFIVGYFWVLSDFIHGRVSVDEKWKDTIGNLLSILTAAVLLILNYWFSRHRTSKEAEESS